MKNDNHIVLENNDKKPDNICEECGKEDKSVKQNLIMHSYKICSICQINLTILYQYHLSYLNFVLLY